MENMNNKNEGINQEEFAILLGIDMGIEAPKESFFEKIKQKIEQKKKEKITKKTDLFSNLSSFDNER